MDTPTAPSDTKHFATATSLGKWWRDGACPFYGPNLFFGQECESTAARIRRERAAKSICDTCPVTAHCRNHALRTGKRFGIWGGMSEQERTRAPVTKQVC